MRFLALIAALCSGVALAACGDGGSTAATTQATQASTTAPQQESAPKKPPGTNAAEPIASSAKPPKVFVPSGPPPNHLVIKDLRKGWGPVTRPHSRLAVNFVAVDYKTGKTFETRWDRPFVFEYDHGLPMQGWEEGLRGMKVGGRRHIVVPSRLAYEQGAIVYVVDLLAVQRRPDFSKERASN